MSDWLGYELDCPSIALEKSSGRLSPYMKARMDANYFSPEDHYEALVSRLITPSTEWLDVGCGKAPFPNNLPLSGRLSKRCARLVGVDPDEQSVHNRFVHESHQSTLEELQLPATFDVVTARMVVEHVRHPDQFAMALARLTHGGSLVALLTVNWLSVTALAAHFSPLIVHKVIKAGLWGTKSEDTFPTVYRLNRRDDLRFHMQNVGFEEIHFQTLADASVFWRFPIMRRLELRSHNLCRRLGISYPESCLLALYQKILN